MAIQSRVKHRRIGNRVALTELHRVYPPQLTRKPTELTPVNIENESLIRKLQARIEAANERLADRETVISDLRENRDKWRRQAGTLLADQRPRPSLWARLIGKNQ